MSAVESMWQSQVCLCRTGSGDGCLGCSSSPTLATSSPRTPFAPSWTKPSTARRLGPCSYGCPSRSARPRPWSWRSAMSSASGPPSGCSMPPATLRRWRRGVTSSAWASGCRGAATPGSRRSSCRGGPWPSWRSAGWLMLQSREGGWGSPLRGGPTARAAS